jgi:leucyl aminopeptidase
MELSFNKLEMPKSGVAIFLIDEDLKMGAMLEKASFKEQIKRAISSSKSFKGKKGHILNIVAPHGSKLDRVTLVGVGKKADVNTLSMQSVGGKIQLFLNSIECDAANIVLEDNKSWKISAEEIACNISLGAKLRSYNFNRYFVDKKDDHKSNVKKLTVLTSAVAKMKNHTHHIDSVANGVFLTRDLVSQPPNVLYPATFADECKKLAKLGVKVTVLDQKEMKKLGMNALLGVGQGSIRESFLVVMEWKGGSKSQKPIAFVGKGVTFDSGGISIKPSANMADMKYDMGGAGTVTGVMHTLASRKAKSNVIGVVGLVENMPSGSAQRPADVVVSMSGQTIEIDNTDAEGRLVLADALWYTQSKYKPEFMINLATLTGAIVIALGENINAGLFSNNDALADKLLKTSAKVGEGLWRMPLKDSYDKQINSEIADVKNTGNGRGAGSITAAQFLQRFVNKYPWAHLDIAGMAWDKTGSDLAPKGATGFGVRLLNQLVADFYEK